MNGSLGNKLLKVHERCVGNIYTYTVHKVCPDIMMFEFEVCQCIISVL